MGWEEQKELFCVEEAVGMLRHDSYGKPDGKLHESTVQGHEKLFAIVCNR